MYFKEQNILLCAIDHGFSTIKTPHFIFDNGVVFVNPKLGQMLI